MHPFNCQIFEQAKIKVATPSGMTTWWTGIDGGARGGALPRSRPAEEDASCNLNINWGEGMCPFIYYGYALYPYVYETTQSLPAKADFLRSPYISVYETRFGDIHLRRSVN